VNRCKACGEYACGPDCSGGMGAPVRQPEKSMLDMWRDKVTRYELALKQIRDMRCSSFRSYREDSEDMRRIAKIALVEPSSDGEVKHDRS
jgi:hypothetical protein